MYLVTPMLESAFHRSFGAIDAAKLRIGPTPRDNEPHCHRTSFCTREWLSI
jgi:hypothetical protein